MRKRVPSAASNNGKDDAVRRDTYEVYSCPVWFFCAREGINVAVPKHYVNDTKFFKLKRAYAKVLLNSSFPLLYRGFSFFLLFLGRSGRARSVTALFTVNKNVCFEVRRRELEQQRDAILVDAVYEVFK